MQLPCDTAILQCHRLPYNPPLQLLAASEKSRLMFRLLLLLSLCKPQHQDGPEARHRKAARHVRQVLSATQGRPPARQPVEARQHPAEARGPLLSQQRHNKGRPGLNRHHAQVTAHRTRAYELRGKNQALLGLLQAKVQSALRQSYLQRL